MVSTTKAFLNDLKFSDLVFYTNGIRLMRSRINHVVNQTAWMNKPDGGLWASPIAHPDDWMSWLEAQPPTGRPYRSNAFDGGTFFTLASSTRMAMLVTPKMYGDVCARWPLAASPIFPHDPTILDALSIIAHGEKPLAYVALDFEAMARSGVDAVYCEPSIMGAMGKFAPVHSWDCASLVVFNPNVIREVRPVEFDPRDRVSTALELYPHLRDRLDMAVQFFNQDDWAPKWVLNLVNHPTAV
jgi:hypothetical protein